MHHLAGGLFLEQRRMAAILTADVLEFSRRMAAGESGTLVRLSRLRAEVFESKTVPSPGQR